MTWNWEGKTNVIIKLEIELQMVEKANSWGLRPNAAWGQCQGPSPASWYHRADDSG